MGAIGICSCFLPAFIYLRYVFRYEHPYQTNQIEHGLNCIEVLKQSFYLVYLIPQCFKKNKKILKHILIVTNLGFEFGFLLQAKILWFVH